MTLSSSEGSVELSEVTLENLCGTIIGSGRDHLVYSLNEIPSGLNSNTKVPVYRALKPEHIGTPIATRSLEQIEFLQESGVEIVEGVNMELQNFRSNFAYSFDMPRVLTQVLNSEGNYIGAIMEDMRSPGNESTPSTVLIPELDTLEERMRHNILQNSFGNPLLYGFLSEIINSDLTPVEISTRLSSGSSQFTSELELVTSLIDSVVEKMRDFDDSFVQELDDPRNKADATVELTPKEDARYDELLSKDTLTIEEDHEFARLELKIQQPANPEESQKKDELDKYSDSYAFLYMYLNYMKGLLSDTDVVIRALLREDKFDSDSLLSQIPDAYRGQQNLEIMENLRLIGLFNYIEIKYGISIDYFLGKNIWVNRETNPRELVLIDVDKISAEYPDAAKDVASEWSKYLFRVDATT